MLAMLWRASPSRGSVESTLNPEPNLTLRASASVHVRVEVEIKLSIPRDGAQSFAQNAAIGLRLYRVQRAIVPLK